MMGWRVMGWSVNQKHPIVPAFKKPVCKYNALLNVHESLSRRLAPRRQVLQGGDGVITRGTTFVECPIYIVADLGGRYRLGRTGRKKKRTGRTGRTGRKKERLDDFGNVM